MELKNISLLNLMKTFDIGGAEKSTILYSNIISDKINQVTIMACKGFYYSGKLIKPNVKTHLFPFLVNYNPLTFFFNLISIKRIIRIEKINCINYHQRIFLPHIFFIKIFYPKVKIIYTAHCVFNDWINKFLIADSFIAISDAVKKDLIDSNKNSILLIEHGIPTNNIIITKLKIEQPINFGYVGRFTELKGIMTLLHAFKFFHSKYPQHKLILRGQGELLEQIKSFISLNSFNDAVTILNPAEDVDQIFAEIDILIFPSEYIEGLGLVLIEAMAKNISIIKSYFEGDEEVFNEENCFLFKPGNANDLFTKMEEAATDLEKREALLKNARIVIKEKFNIDKTIDQYLSLLQDL